MLHVTLKLVIALYRDVLKKNNSAKSFSQWKCFPFTPDWLWQEFRLTPQPFWATVGTVSLNRTSFPVAIWGTASKNPLKHFPHWLQFIQSTSKFCLSLTIFPCWTLHQTFHTSFGKHSLWHATLAVPGCRSQNGTRAGKKIKNAAAF